MVALQSTHHVVTLLWDLPHPKEIHCCQGTAAVVLLPLQCTAGRESPLSLLGLGDGTALEPMDSMLSLLGTDDSGFLFTHLFLRNLLAPVQAGLANFPLLVAKDYHSFAEETDCILLATRSFRHPGDSSRLSDGISHAPTDFYHRCFGSPAWHYLLPCSFKAQGNEPPTALYHWR